MLKLFKLVTSRRRSSVESLLKDPRVNSCSSSGTGTGTGNSGTGTGSGTCSVRG